MENKDEACMSVRPYLLRFSGGLRGKPGGQGEFFEKEIKPHDWPG